MKLKFVDDSTIVIDALAVENKDADTMHQRSELNNMIYNEPVGYAELILNSNSETYLKTAME